jgi:hypothetical protein
VWYSQYGKDANWLMETGELGIVALEIDLKLAGQSLAHLGPDDWPWQQTLSFTNRELWFALFTYAQGLPSLSGRYSGLRLHAGTSVLVPPSRTPNGVELVYQDSRAELFPYPWRREFALLR